MHSGQSGDYRGMPPGGIAVLTLPADAAIEPGVAQLARSGGRDGLSDARLDRHAAAGGCRRRRGGRGRAASAMPVVSDPPRRRSNSRCSTRWGQTLARALSRRSKAKSTRCRTAAARCGSNCDAARSRSSTTPRYTRFARGPRFFDAAALSRQSSSFPIPIRRALLQTAARCTASCACMASQRRETFRPRTGARASAPGAIATIVAQRHGAAQRLRPRRLAAGDARRVPLHAARPPARRCAP